MSSFLSQAPKLISSKLIQVQPMSPPVGNLFFTDFNIVPPYIEKWQNYYNVIVVKFLDTIDNYLKFIERKDILVLHQSCEIDTKFIDKTANIFRNFYESFGADPSAASHAALVAMGMMADYRPKNLTMVNNIESDQDWEYPLLKNKFITVDAVIMTEETKFVEEHSVAVMTDKSKPSSEELEYISCDKFVRLMYSKNKKRMI